MDKHLVVLGKPLVRETIVLMDTAYWGRGFGVMLFKDAIIKENLVKYYLTQETNSLYKEQ
jgi:hypothetical protein